MIPAIIMGAMAGLQLIGGIMQSQQMRAAGSAAKAAGKYQQQLAESRALALEQQAGQEQASAQRNMLAERQQGALISGRSRALAAASGADMSSPSIVHGLADLAGVEDYRTQSALFEGNTRAASLRYGAGVERAGGQAARQAGSFEERLANARANASMLASIGQAGMTGLSAYGMSGGGGAAAVTPTQNTPTWMNPGGAQMGQYQLGWSNSPSMLQYGSPMFAKYGQGGP